MELAVVKQLLPDEQDEKQVKKLEKASGGLKKSVKAKPRPRPKAEASSPAPEIPEEGTSSPALSGAQEEGKKRQRRLPKSQP